MNTGYRYSLEKGSKKHPCPSCHKIRLVRYLDKETGQYLPENYGRCDRESRCGYHLNPYRDGYAKATGYKEGAALRNAYPSRATKPRPLAGPDPESFDFETFKKTLEPGRYAVNAFIQNLLHRGPFPFDPKDIERVISLYRLGTVSNGYRAGGITFPFIDTQGRVRAIQVKQFDKSNHTTGTDFLHSIIEREYSRKGQDLPEWLRAYMDQEKKVSCLFGEHLLAKYPINPIALVEAPKTAVYCSLYFGFPDRPENLIWLAVYNKSSFSIDKIGILKGRDIYVFPDLSEEGKTYQEWKTKSKEFEEKLPGTRFIFSDLLEKLAPPRDRIEGADLADFLIKLDWRQFRNRTLQEQPTLRLDPEQEVNEKVNQQPANQGTSHALTDQERLGIVQKIISDYRTKASPDKPAPNAMENDRQELEQYFKSITIPAGPFRIGPVTVNDPMKAIQYHLAGLKTALPGSLAFKADYYHLRSIKTALEAGKSVLK